MGTVPSPITPGAGTAAASAQAKSWADSLNFLLQPPSCRAMSFVSQTITGAANVLFASESWDLVQSLDTEMHSTSTNTDRITIRTAGRYRVHGEVTFSAAAAYTPTIGVQKNGSWVTTLSFGIASGQMMAVPFSDEVYCAVGDYLTFSVAAGSTLTFRGDLANVSMTVTWVSN